MTSDVLGSVMKEKCKEATSRFLTANYSFESVFNALTKRKNIDGTTQKSSWSHSFFKQAATTSEGNYTELCHPSYVSSSENQSFLEADLRCLFKEENGASEKEANVSPSNSKRTLVKPTEDLIGIHRNHLLQQELRAHRSKSLSQIDCLDGDNSAKIDNMESKSEPNSTTAPAPNYASDRLLVPSHIDDIEARNRARGMQRMSSKEYFRVSFEIASDLPDEVIPAAHGIALREALQGLLDYRGIDINEVNIFLDSSSTPLPLQFETFRLGGHHLTVKAKESIEGGHITRTNSTGSCGSGRTNVSNSSGKDDRKERKVSGSQRGRRNAVMTSTEDLVGEALYSSFSGSQDGSWKSNKSKQLQQRRGGIFSNPFRSDKEKMETLTELLNQYSQHGVPELHGLLTFSSYCEHRDDLYQLEDHWSQIVENVQELSKRKQNQQDAIWEMLSTEVFYIRRLKVIIDFLSVLCNLQNECILNEIETEKIFGNIREVYESNYHFWIDYLLPMVHEARMSRKPLNPIFMKEGFLKFDQIFQPYIKYCLEQDLCLQYVKERRKDSELFKAYVAWCETQKDCERLRLVDLLVKPMQRLTKYSLLLKVIHKKTDNEEHKSALLEMNECVENFVCGVDATLRQRHEQERLASIIGRIESYKLSIESNNDELEKIIKDNCFLDLTCQMPGCGNQQSRQLLLEGTGFKLKDPPSSKQIDVQCFLFTDMLLICKATGKKGDKVRVIRQPYIVDRLVLQELKDGSGLLVVYLNEYKVATTAFLLYTNESKHWLDNIRRAQELYKEAKSAAASERPQLEFLKPIEEEDYDFPSMALLSARSPRSSSRSSLVHSHSGSIDMNDTSNNLQTAISPSSGQPQAKAISIELGELRNPSLTCDDGSQIRAKSMETWLSGPISVTVTSPRPERRAFFLRGAGGNIASNTLSVGTPYQMGETADRISPPSIQVPTVLNLPKTCDSVRGSSNNGSLQRGSSAIAKPPLLKTKNVSNATSVIVHLPNNGQNTESEKLYASNTESLRPRLIETEDENRCKVINKRTCRAERRYHTADSIENIKKEKDSSIHKRLSWNYGQHSTGSLCTYCEKTKNKHLSQCLSMESVHSSSGVSSNTSLHLSAGSMDYDGGFEGSDILEEDTDQADDAKELEMVNGGHCTCSALNNPAEKMTVGPPGSNIKIDVSEVRDGISSVQIAENGGCLSHNKPSKVDLRRMKEFLLTNCSVEASEV
ncbi:pleckstrin homology domain-containing family G member 5-like isoform X3 [Centruroides vittatus]|uniref:pleckstrin homology domain-containing family G member 5-like isoform X3 n=1 Tax=Centruroides vittatus TaxID=120091 RepID=UPI00350FDC00